MKPDKNELDLTAFAMGELSFWERARITRRLRRDPGLRAELEGIRATLERVRSLPPRPVSPELHHRVLARYRRFLEAKRAEPIVPNRRRLPEWIGFFVAYVRFRVRASAAFRVLAVSTAIAVHALIFLLVARLTVSRIDREDAVHVVDVRPAGEGEELLPGFDPGRAEPRSQEIPAPEPIAPELAEIPVPRPSVPEDLALDSEPPTRIWSKIPEAQNRLRVARWIFFARHPGSRREELLARHGGDEQTQRAVGEGLRWLAGQQDASGGFPVAALGGDPHYEPALVGLAVLAFLGDGHSLTRGEHRPEVEKAVALLVSRQEPSGHIGGPRESGRTYLYNHAIALHALLECYLMSLSARELAEPIERAVRYLADAQNEDGGWRYMPGGIEAASDASVTCWALSAAWLARNAGFLAAGDPAIDRAARFLQDLSEPSGAVRYRKVEPTSAQDALTRTAAVHSVLEAVDDAGTERRARMGLLTRLAGSRPTAGESWVALHGLTEALFQIGGPAWDAWNDRIREWVLSNQRSDGSFPPGPLYGSNGGSLAATALGCLILEVYYRYPRHAG